MNHKAKSRNESSHHRKTAAGIHVQSEKRYSHSICSLKSWYRNAEGRRNNIAMHQPGLVLPTVNLAVPLPLLNGTVLCAEMGPWIILSSPGSNVKLSPLFGIGWRHTLLSTPAATVSHCISGYLLLTGISTWDWPGTPTQKGRNQNTWSPHSNLFKGLIIYFLLVFIGFLKVTTPTRFANWEWFKIQ